jgi:hypothetical protein
MAEAIRWQTSCEESLIRSELERSFVVARFRFLEGDLDVSMNDEGTFSYMNSREVPGGLVVRSVAVWR